ncbi:uncharacterized protein LOC119573431 [Penaeus monodon]|uniref:uncharacterized protein LOC119573431 n=1 Tax=Penaeus monodon TaxID=6687 RepID=UPI0018A789B5|nr:uncharacterized protein LOC119573431 [Penaeus monodon]
MAVTKQNMRVFSPTPVTEHGPTQPSYHPQPSYNPAPAYHTQPSYEHEYEPAVPECAANTTKPGVSTTTVILPTRSNTPAEYLYDKLLSLYADVADLNTGLSNTEGKWRVIVNNIDVHYQTVTQTTRIEECLTFADLCPLVPDCYESKCLQKSIYHRFLVYDPYDQYFPFAIETFKFPASYYTYRRVSYFRHRFLVYDPYDQYFLFAGETFKLFASCACLLGAYTIDH